ncbi:MAG: alpha-glucosidase C-terminal domain-containing protein, partial [Janthinobacterium lividum]
AMYGWYAPDPRMRANIGIRRRLAPLLDNSRPEIQLIQAMVLSLPGSPCLYYGDEIGMGDNIWLEDRDAVRTPMQWTPDRNAGFSAADPGKLYLPTIQSLVYNYQAVNVEAQLATGSSLLHWVRNVLAVRRAHPAFGLGGFVPLTSRHPALQEPPATGALASGDALADAAAPQARPDDGYCSNAAVLAFLRILASTDDQEGETVLCVNNLSDHAQSAVLRMPGKAGAKVRDLFGGAAFPDVDADAGLTITIGPRDFFWLKLVGGA